MSIEWILSSSGLILLVLTVRLLFRKRMSPRFNYALWLIVALRLLFPFSISETDISILNLLPQENTSDGDSTLSEPGMTSWPENSIIEENKPLENAGEKTSIVQADDEEHITEKTDRTTKNYAKQKIEGWKIQEIFFTKEKRMEANKALCLFWLLGAGFCGSVIFMMNLVYNRRLRRSRKRIVPENLPVITELPVYETQMIQTPCLFGLLEPAVYVTENAAREEKTFRFVLWHENMHYRQHDHWWAFVRILCFCVHWFNPLVWLAAHLSRQDGELSCDIKTLKILGEEARVDYGRALLEMSAERDSYINELRVSTSMSGNARQMRERLRAIVNAPGRAIGIQVLVMALMLFLSVITFTGKSMAQEKENPAPGEINQMAEITKNDETKESLKEYHEIENDESFFTYKGGEIQEVDLNFDGWNDLCFQGWSADEIEPSYYCMLWNSREQQYEYSVMLHNVEVDAERQWIAEKREDGNGRHSTIYYRYGEDNQLHMVRYVEENQSPDAVFTQLDLTYVETDSIYMLPAIVDGTDFHCTMIDMARQSLMELYQWTGEKVDTACFQIATMDNVYFGMTPEDIIHSRIFYSRAFGADSAYNLSNYERSISSMYVESGRDVWYSPVLWRIFPERMDEMTDEEIIIWYLERTPLVRECRVKSIEKHYEDMWTVQSEEGVWFEVGYNVPLKEVDFVSGPYPDHPEH